MAKFVRFADALISQSGPPDQGVYINPDHVRTVRTDHEHGSGSVIGMQGYEISVREDLDKVIQVLSSAPRT
jgi:hypothetical protein